VLEWNDDLVLLHLSDLHAGDPNCWWCRPTGPYGREIRYEEASHEQLVSALGRLDPPIQRLDAVVVSGDIANHAEPHEYEAAAELLLGIKAAARHAFGSLVELFLVPGNHDVNWRHDAATVQTSSRESERRLAGLAEYLEMVGNVNGRGFSRDAHDCWLPLGNPGAENRAWLLGLSSCLREGKEVCQHYGYVGTRQVRDAVECRSTEVSPWDLQLAVFHHAVALNAPTSVAQIDLASSEGRTGDHAALIKTLTDSLQGAEGTLRALGSHGVRVVLHGHQHFDGPIHVSLPVKDPSDPWEAGGMTLIGAGSFGLTTGAPGQRGPASCQVLRFRAGPPDWELILHRVIVRADGSVLPHLDLPLEPPRRVPLLSVRTFSHYKALSALARSVPRPRPPAPSEWAGRVFSPIREWPRIAYLADRPSWDPDGISPDVVMHWAWANPYNELLEHHVVDAKLGADRRVDLAVGPGRFAEVMATGEFAATGIKDSVITAASSGLGGLLEVVRSRATKAVRLSLDAFGMVRLDNRTWLLIPRRSDRVALEPNTMNTTVGGGLRESHLSIEEIERLGNEVGDQAAIAVAMRREATLETGIAPRSLTPVGMGLDACLAVSVLAVGWWGATPELATLTQGEAREIIGCALPTTITAAKVSSGFPGPNTRDRWEGKSWLAFAAEGDADDKVREPDAAVVAMRRLARQLATVANERWSWGARAAIRFFSSDESVREEECRR
jgi:3',5'-cyclic AMP phosphodiesterase CpdA